MIIAVDFDGTICGDRWPLIGPPNMWMIHFLIDLKKDGHKLILWTCRKDEPLQKAVNFCKMYGLEFDAVNTNVPEIIEAYGGDNRKVYADWYIDDHNKTLGEIRDVMSIKNIDDYTKARVMHESS